MTLLKPGVKLKAYEKAVGKYLGTRLKDLGLVKSLKDEEIRQFCPHATSHFMGLNVHDTGDYTLPLQEDMVLTVEPGIYIPDESIGVRIEDDVVITKDGARSISAALPQKLY
jgi:Xaa-Pro aminopeptidase